LWSTAKKAANVNPGVPGTAQRKSGGEHLIRLVAVVSFAIWLPQKENGSVREGRGGRTGISSVYKSSQRHRPTAFGPEKEIHTTARGAGEQAFSADDSIEGAAGLASA